MNDYELMQQTMALYKDEPEVLKKRLAILLDKPEKKVHLTETSSSSEATNSSKDGLNSNDSASSRPESAIINYKVPEPVQISSQTSHNGLQSSVNSSVPQTPKRSLDPVFSQRTQTPRARDPSKNHQRVLPPNYRPTLPINLMNSENEMKFDNESFFIPEEFQDDSDPKWQRTRRIEFYVHNERFANKNKTWPWIHINKIWQANNYVFIRAQLEDKAENGVLLQTIHGVAYSKNAIRWGFLRKRAGIIVRDCSKNYKEIEKGFRSEKDEDSQYFNGPWTWGECPNWKNVKNDTKLELKRFEKAILGQHPFEKLMAEKDFSGFDRKLKDWNAAKNFYQEKLQENERMSERQMKAELVAISDRNAERQERRDNGEENVENDEEIDKSRYPDYFFNRKIGIWLYGPSGVGKTFRASCMFPEMSCFQKHDDGKWFDGYNGQEVIMIDELNKKNAAEIAHKLKIWCTPYWY